MREAALHRPVDWSGFPPYVPLGVRRPPAKPPATPVKADVAASDSGALVAVESDDLETPPAIVEANPADDEPGLQAGVTATLEIAVWRRRRFWRLAARFVARRLR
jgi:hypothetical protein